MNKFKKTGIGLLVMALSVAALAVQDAVSIKRVAKAGDSAKYRLKADIDFQGMEANFTALVLEKITKIETNGNYVVESTYSEGKVVFSGQEMDAPGTTSTYTYKPTGEVVSIVAETVDSNVYRTAHLTSFVVPDKALKVGDEWATEIKKDEKTGAVAAKGAYKIEAEEKVGDFETFKVKYSTKESEGGDTAAVCEGVAWVNKKDGSLVKTEGVWKNVPFPGAPAPLNAKFTMVREK
jgi:hypothetical protein